MARKRTRSEYDGYGKDVITQVDADGTIHRVIYDRDSGTYYAEQVMERLTSQARAVPQPTKADIARDFSARYKRRDVRFNIRFETAAALRRAVLVFGGAPPGGMLENAMQIGENHGGMASGMFLMAMHGGQDPESLAKRIAQQIGDLEGPEGLRGYSKSWDYDGPGPFHKASLMARREEDGSFSLHISAAYVGNRPEIELARKLGAPVGFARIDIDVLFAPLESGDRFAIPVDSIAALHNTITGRQDFDIQQFMATFQQPMMNSEIQGRVDALTSPVVIPVAEGIQARIGMLSWRSVSPYARRDEPNRDYGFRLEGDLLTGPAQMHAAFNRAEAAAIEVVLAPTGGLCWDPVVEAQVVTIADQVEFTLKHLGIPNSKGDEY